MAAPEFFFLWGASRGQSAILSGQKSKNGLFWPFFFLTGGGKWVAEPHAPLDAATGPYVKTIKYLSVYLISSHCEMPQI